MDAVHVTPYDMCTAIGGSQLCNIAGGSDLAEGNFWWCIEDTILHCRAAAEGWVTQIREVGH